MASVRAPARKTRKPGPALASTVLLMPLILGGVILGTVAVIPCCLDGLHGLDGLRSVYAGASQDDGFVPDGRHRPNRG